jgi:hypothetical protein
VTERVHGHKRRYRSCPDLEVLREHTRRDRVMGRAKSETPERRYRIERLTRGERVVETAWRLHAS